MGGLNAFYWYQIFALDSAVVGSTRKYKLTWRHSSYCNVSSWRKTLIESTHFDETKEMANDSQIVRAEESFKLSNGWPSFR